MFIIQKTSSKDKRNKETHHFHATVTLLTQSNYMLAIVIKSVPDKTLGLALVSFALFFACGRKEKADVRNKKKTILNVWYR